MYFGILGLLLFIASFAWLVYSLLKGASAKKPLIGMLIGFVLFVGGVMSDEEPESTVKEPEVSEAKKESEPKETKEELAKKEKEKQAAEEKKEQEAKIKEEEKEAKAAAESESIAAEEALKDPANYRTDVTYDQIARTPDEYMFQNVAFSGKVIQVMEGTDGLNQLRVAINENYDTVMLVEYSKDILDSRVLEEDYITFYGMSLGVFTYESALGGNITIPGVSANMITY